MENNINTFSEEDWEKYALDVDNAVTKNYKQNTFSS